MSFFQQESSTLNEELKSVSSVIINDKYENNSLLFEYTSNAKPKINEIQSQIFSNEYFTLEGNYIYKLNNAGYYKTNYDCTSPSLLSSFIRLEPTSVLDHYSEGTYNLFYVQQGRGETHTKYGIIKWKTGDIFALPFTDTTIYHKNIVTDNCALLYYVNDAPLLNYLNVKPKSALQNPVYFSKEFLEKNVSNIVDSSDSDEKNRTGVLLSDIFMEKQDIITLSPLMWSLYDIIGKQHMHKPHRHNSVAIDLCTYAPVGDMVYTLMSKELDSKGNLVDPIKCLWKTGCVFVTPPGWWHSHHNESDERAYVFPVQDAGLHTYLRTLDITFS